MATLVLSTQKHQIISCFITDEKDKETKQPTWKKLVVLKYAGKQKKDWSKYREDCILQKYVDLTKIEEVLKLKNPTQDQIMSSLQGKNLVIETGFSSL